MEPNSVVLEEDKRQLAQLFALKIKFQYALHVSIVMTQNITRTQAGTVQRPGTPSVIYLFENTPVEAHIPSSFKFYI